MKQNFIFNNITDVVFLHGFLGMPSDGHFLKKLGTDYRYHFLEYFNDSSFSPNNDFETWSNNFKNYLSQFPKPLVVGYSLGGRLALNTLRSYDFSLLMISSRWGIDPDSIEGQNELNLRIDSDLRWQNQFLNSNWNELISNWNRQLVFNGSMNEPQRFEFDYNRKTLALALKNWGLPLQPYFPDFYLNKNWIYMIGENDSGYVKRSNDKLIGYLNERYFIAPKAGHRVIFDNPDFILKTLSQFLQPNKTKGLRRTL